MVVPLLSLHEQFPPLMVLVILRWRFREKKEGQLGLEEKQGFVATIASTQNASIYRNYCVLTKSCVIGFSQT
jgi:hypothetical protein